MGLLRTVRRIDVSMCLAIGPIPRGILNMKCAFIGNGLQSLLKSI